MKSCIFLSVGDSNKATTPIKSLVQKILYQPSRNSFKLENLKKPKHDYL